MLVHLLILSGFGLSSFRVAVAFHAAGCLCGRGDNVDLLHILQQAGVADGQAVATDLPHLAVRSGGSTSVDISARGIDKSFAVQELARILGIDVHQIIFVGDRMDPDGNDYPAAVAGTRAVRVTGPADTVMLCDDIIESLRGQAG